MATRRCKHGRKKTARKGCKSKPGPKRGRRSRKRRSSNKCARGMKKGSRSCKRKPGPKRGSRKRRSRKRSSRKRRCKRGRRKGSKSCRRKPGRKALKFRMQQLVDNM